MKNFKRELPMFSFYSYTSIQRHLEKRAREGWRLIKAEKGGWLYRRMDPKDLHYAVVYFPDSSQFDPAPTEGQQTLRDYCLAAGWEPVTGWGQAQIYCNPQPDPVPIETEPSVQLSTIRRTMRRTFLPDMLSSAVLFLGLWAMQLANLYRDPAEYLASSSNLWLLLSLLLGLLSQLMDVGGYVSWLLRSKRSIANGGGCVCAVGHPWRTRGLLLAMFAALLFQLLAMANAAMYGFAALHLLGMAGISYAAWRLQGNMKRRKFSRTINRAITMGTILALSVLLLAALTAGLFMSLHAGVGERKPAQTYEYFGQTWEVYHDALPLRLEDLMPVDSSCYSTELRTSSSPLLERWEADQNARFDAPKGLPDLSYELVFYKVPALRALVEQGYVRRVQRYNRNIPEEYLAEHGESYQAADPAPWGADRVYQRYTGGNPSHEFLLCWEDRIALIRFYWDPAPVQRAAAGKLLKAA